jgi:serine/threonine-protein kinase RsbW
VPNREQRTFTGDIPELRRISAWWREWAAAAGLDDDRLRRGELCLNEAVANIIQHGRPRGEQRTIDIALEGSAQSVDATIADDGPLFNPLEYSASESPRTPDTARAGGLGIPLMLRLASEVKYRRADGRNILTLIFD